MTTPAPLSSAVAMPPERAAGRIRKTKTRVLIVDNNELVRRGLAALVNGEVDMASCGEIACGEASSEAVARRRPDVVMIDVSAARGEGLQAIQRIRKSDAKIRIVALAMNDRPEFVERVYSAGAAMLVMKTDLALRVLETIRRSQTERKGDATGKAQPPAARAGGRNLDKAEREIVEMIGRGIPTRAIAMHTGMSVAMVEAHRRRICSKLNNPTASQLVQFCVRWVEQAGVPKAKAS